MALAPSSPSRRPGYRASSRRWHVLARRWLAAACLLAPALATAGCSFAYQLDNRFADGRDADRSDVSRRGPAQTTAAAPAEADLAIARAALGELLAKGGKHTSMPWENPKTGARGTVTPLAAAHDEDGITCRDFELREGRQ